MLGPDESAPVVVNKISHQLSLRHILRRALAIQASASWSGFRRRGCRNDVASDFFRYFFRFLPFVLSVCFFLFVSVFFRLLRFFSVSFRFFPFFFFSGSDFIRFLLFLSVVFLFFLSFVFCFLLFFSRFLFFSEKTGRHRSRDPFCETPSS